MKTPKLTLIGAGPGDPDLLSIRGMKTIAKADVVLYDALVHPDLLEYAPDDALKIFVGKKVGFCEFAQHDIHDLIVYHALNHGHVVRLKGGDPFVFGRGYEEIQHAHQFGIETEVVPGISSCIAVPGLQGIPVTSRGLSQSFWVLTGTTMNHELSKDIAIAVQTKTTLVILMGMKNLRQITSLLKENGKADVPVAIIQDGSFRNERSVLGTATTIVEKAEMHQLKNPAIIVIGEVVTLHPNYETNIAELRR
jgi:uroporphyrin-III C-methyltransferase